MSTNEKPQKPLTESITNILKLLPTYRKPSKRLHTHIYRFITEVEIILDGFEMPTTHWPKMLYFLVPLPQAMWIKKNVKLPWKDFKEGFLNQNGFKRQRWNDEISFYQLRMRPGQDLKSYIDEYLDWIFLTEKRRDDDSLLMLFLATLPYEYANEYRMFYYFTI